MDAHEEASVHDAPVVRNIAGATVANEPLDPDVAQARRLRQGEAVAADGPSSFVDALVALVEKAVNERHIIASQWEHGVKACGLLKEERDAALRARDALAKQANEMEERAERNAVLHAEVMRERDALLKPHNSDGTITCPECHKSMGGDGLVEALAECVKERDAAVSNLTAFIEADTNRTILMMRTGLAIEARDKALAAQKEAEMYRKGAEYNEGLMRADLEAVEKERDMLRDKWNQMEAYGFDSPSKVFARLEAAEKAQKEAEERLKEAHVMDCSCGVVSLRGQSVDPDCSALRTRTETKA